MKKKNNYISESLSFEDFEQSIAQRSTGASIDEIVKDRLSEQKEARQKEQQLKREKRKR